MGGVTTCDKHGQVSLVRVCEHIHAQIEAGETPVGHRIDGVGWLMVCEQCFRTGGFDEVAKLPGPPALPEDRKNWSREMQDEDHEWSLKMLEAIEAPYATLQNPRGYCLRCLDAHGPKVLSNPTR